MDDSVTVEMLDGAEHLAHDVSGVALSELLGSDNAVEKFSTFAVFHDNVDVAEVNEALIKFDDVGVVHRLQNGELLFQKFNILSDVFSQNRLDRKSRRLRVTLQGGCTDCAKVATTDHLDK